jgi:predicted O-methyltransferase YrrM
MKEFNKILPNQKILQANFLGSKVKYEKRIYNICLRNTSLEIPLIQSFRGISEVPKVWMSSNSLSLGFYAFLIKLVKPKRILEIGTFIGRATKTFLMAADKDCKVWTIEKFKSASSAAKQNLQREIQLKRCCVLDGDAREVLNSENFKKKKFDFVFIDGDKGAYDQYLKILKNRLYPRGVIVIDDIFFQGDSMNKVASTEKGKGVKKCIALARKLKGFNKICIPLGNGILILQKK